MRYDYKNILILFVILALGCFFRLYKFTTIPFGLNHDAARLGLVAIDLWQKLPEYIPYYPAWIGATLYDYWIGLNFIFFGISPPTLRLASVTIGIVTLPAFYLLSFLLQGRLTALFSLFFLSISGWHITVNKVGWLENLVPLFQSLTFIFIYKALKHNKKRHWIGSGIFLAVTLNTYAAATVTPLIVITVISFWYLSNKEKFKQSYKNILYFLITFLIVIQPLFQFAINNWEIYSGRANFLSVTNRIKEVGSLEPVFENIKTSIGILHYRANGNDFFVNEPLLEKIPGYLFLVGLIYILFTIKKFESFIIATWLFAGFLPGLLTVPNGNHDFSILVPVYLIIGQGLAFILALIRKLPKQIYPIGYMLMGLVLILSATDAYQQYLSKNRREIFSVYPETTIIAQYMKKYRTDYDFYLTDNYPRDALTFITYTGGPPSYTGGPLYKKNYTWFENGYDFLNVRQDKKGLMFFMLENVQNESLALSLQQKFPGSKKIYLPYIDDNISRIASLVIVVPPKK